MAIIDTMVGQLVIMVIIVLRKDRPVRTDRRDSLTFEATCVGQLSQFLWCLLSWCKIVWCQIVWVAICPVPNCLGAKLSGCQIVRCEIVLPSWTWLSENMKDPNLRWPGHWGRRSKLTKKVESSRIFFLQVFVFQETSDRAILNSKI